VAVTIYGMVASDPSWWLRERPQGVMVGSMVSFRPWPVPGAVQATYLNKCIDGITGQWHFWQTFFQDTQGVDYKASGGQQFDAATYRVEAIVHGREQI
jgi:hypothetical protein